MKSFLGAQLFHGAISQVIFLRFRW